MSFTVNATDTSGNTGAATVSYTVSNAIATALLPSGSMSDHCRAMGTSSACSDSSRPARRGDHHGDRPEPHEHRQGRHVGVRSGFTVRIAPGSTVTLTCGSIRGESQRLAPPSSSRLPVARPRQRARRVRRVGRARPQRDRRRSAELHGSHRHRRWRDPDHHRRHDDVVARVLATTSRWTWAACGTP